MGFWDAVGQIFSDHPGGCPGGKNCHLLRRPGYHPELDAITERRNKESEQEQERRLANMTPAEREAYRNSASPREYDDGDGRPSFR